MNDIHELRTILWHRKVQVSGEKENRKKNFGVIIMGHITPEIVFWILRLLDRKHMWISLRINYTISRGLFETNKSDLKEAPPSQAEKEKALVEKLA